MKVFGFKVHGSSVALQPSVREAYKRSLTSSKRLEGEGDEGNRKKSRGSEQHDYYEREKKTFFFELLEKKITNVFFIYLA
jgi:hypothetical protein